MKECVIININETVTFKMSVLHEVCYTAAFVSCEWVYACERRFQNYSDRENDVPILNYSARS